jgi:hypothetical protein
VRFQSSTRACASCSSAAADVVVVVVVVVATTGVVLLTAVRLPLSEEVAPTIVVLLVPGACRRAGGWSRANDPIPIAALCMVAMGRGVWCGTVAWPGTVELAHGINRLIYLRINTTSHLSSSFLYTPRQTDRRHIYIYIYIY